VSDQIPVLDHGYVQLVEHWGSDERIIEAARMSTDKGFQGWGGAVCLECLPGPFRHDCGICKGTGVTVGDEKLLRYLWTNRHTTPFEMAGLTIEVQAPIFVFREWHRHRTQSYNELSARYTPIPDVNYLPTLDRLLMTSGTNKQAQSIHDVRFESGNGVAWLHDLETFYNQAQHLYRMGLAMGLPKEIARVCLPVGRYSRMRASTDLWNWLHFLRLRMASNAQFEIREYANVVAGLLRQIFPRTMQLFDEK